MKPPTLLLIVLGTLFGPAYFVYCEYLSGETAEMHTLTERAGRSRSGLAQPPARRRRYGRRR